MPTKRRADPYDEHDGLNALEDVREGSSQRATAQKREILRQVISGRNPNVSCIPTALAAQSSPKTRILLNKVAKAFERLAVNIVLKDLQIQQLKAEYERLRHKRRRKVSNLNRKLVQIAQISSASQRQNESREFDAKGQVAVREEVEEDEVKTHSIVPTKVTRYGREMHAPARYNN
jgi:hypothetical protein